MTACIIGSYKHLQPNSTDTAAILLLAQISHQLATLSSGLPSPPCQDCQVNHQPHVDVLWFINLVLNLKCAFLATLMQ